MTKNNQNNPNIINLDQAEKVDNRITENNSSNEDRSSYRQIFKATSLFGGVQVINILIGIIRVKFVAVLLGTAGVGIMGLLNAPIQLIISITGLGIAFSAVRDVSEANAKEDGSAIARTIIILRRWSWFTGLFGAIVTISFAPLLSEWTFGTTDYTWSFVWLSVILLLHAIMGGQKAVLQGTRQLKSLAKAGVLGSAFGLVTAIPLYYFYGLDGIVPSMIITALTALILSWYYSRKVIIQQQNISKNEMWSGGLSMAKLGISMTLAGFISTLSTYILNAYISNNGGVEQVGLYNAGWGVVGQYTGIVFTAMATDYFPRLSAVQDNNEQVKKLVSQQAETALLIMTPLLALMIVSMPIVVRVLYTSAFLPVVMFANLTVLGMQFKAVSWAMGYVFLAKGDSRLFLFLEILSGAVMLGFNLIFYSLFGLNGLGISFILSFIIGGAIAFIALWRKYSFGFPRTFFLRFLTTYSIVVVSFSTVFISNSIYRYGAGIFLFVLAASYSYVKLNQLMDIKQLVLNKIRRK